MFSNFESEAESKLFIENFKNDYDEYEDASIACNKKEEPTPTPKEI